LSYQLPHWVWPAVILTVCALAVWRGRDEERLAVGSLLAAWALSMVVYRSQSQDTQWAILAIDTGLFLSYLWIALRTARWWPLFLAGFELLALMTHMAHAVDPSLSGWAYWTAERLWSYLGVFTIGYAAWTAPYFAPGAEEPPSSARSAAVR
jgi:hypothetical protein